MPSFLIKDGSAVLDYIYDFSEWLAVGETISTATVTVPTGLTLDSSSITDGGTSVTAWLSGGTSNHRYSVVCEIVTTAGRTDDRTMTIQVQDR